jgi:ADP-heptose:LPS heptosyltransferase
MLLHSRVLVDLQQSITDQSMVIHTDCKYYKGSMPCDFHKKDGRLCESCPDYSKVGTRILIVKLAAVGDVLRTTSILGALVKKYSSTQISWITRLSAAPLLVGNPLIDRVLTAESNYLEYLRNERFDVGICLDADPLSATIHSIATCDERFGFVSDQKGSVQPANELAVEWWLMGLHDQKKKANRKTYQQIMHEVCSLPLPTERPQIFLNGNAAQFGKNFLHLHHLNGKTKILGINTGGGARWQYKKWTFEGYVGLIKLLHAAHPDVGILLLGGPEEVELNARILEDAGDSVVDGGCTNSLTEFASLVNTVDVLLTSDSLAMHIGVALKKSTVVLVGPTSPWELDVFGNGKILHSDIECLACYLPRCDKTVTCMNTLSPEFVYAQLQEYL